MTMATITSKGQVTIPKEVREFLGLDSGDRVEFIRSEQGVVRLVPATKDIKSLKGIVAKPKKTVSLVDMKHAIKTRGGKL